MNGPDVHFIKALWGHESIPHPELLKRIKEAGYEGFETPVAGAPAKSLIADSGLEFVGMLFPDTVEDFKKGVDQALQLDPVLINVHAGKDWWSLAEGEAFFEKALAVPSPVPICFETHRARLLHEPKSAAHFLRKFPELQVTADFSHWTCVCGSLLHDQSESLDLAIHRAGYIHARVGHQEGPQVPDPRVPMWEGHVAHFEKWWDRIRLAHHEKGDAKLYVDVEFGPPNYMWTDPQSGKPLSDLWDVCLWMRDRLKARWA